VNANFERMCRRSGSYSLPWLIKLNNGISSLYLINDNTGIEYLGNTYIPCALSYIPNMSTHGMTGGGTLEVATDSSLNSFVQLATGLSMEAIGILLSDGTIAPIKTYNHFNGIARTNGRKASFVFEQDSRLDMTFPALIFSHYNMRGAT
jgi:hypothetical protein